MNDLKEIVADILEERLYGYDDLIKSLTEERLNAISDGQEEEVISLSIQLMAMRQIEDEIESIQEIINETLVTLPPQ
ncbi:MAG: hypothetical protein DRQ42_09880 [Gammaproteobacteria bacterium]|nr:MAG: hypothetical protein DRQ42_09880 [Gammaproteobacteria bacterium]